MSYDFDLFVIGGGSGGIATARRAAEYGANVGVAEFNRLGGTCVNRGCIPKKLMVYASNFPDQFKDAQGYGWSEVHSTFDWKKNAYRCQWRSRASQRSLRANARQKQGKNCSAPMRDCSIHTPLK